MISMQIKKGDKRLEVLTAVSMKIRVTLLKTLYLQVEGRKGGKVKNEFACFYFSKAQV